MGQNATMQAQWEKLGFTRRRDRAHDTDRLALRLLLQPTGTRLTALVVIVYFLFVFRLSAKEYNDVIAERFDR